MISRKTRNYITRTVGDLGIAFIHTQLIPNLGLDGDLLWKHLFGDSDPVSLVIHPAVRLLGGQVSPINRPCSWLLVGEPGVLLPIHLNMPGSVHRIEGITTMYRSCAVGGYAADLTGRGPWYDIVEQLYGREKREQLARTCFLVPQINPIRTKLDDYLAKSISLKSVYHKLPAVHQLVAQRSMSYPLRAHHAQPDPPEDLVAILSTLATVSGLK